MVSVFQETVGLQAGWSILQVHLTYALRNTFKCDRWFSVLFLITGCSTSSIFHQDWGHRSLKRLTGWRKCSVKVWRSLCPSARPSCFSPGVMYHAGAACTLWFAVSLDPSSNAMEEHLHHPLCRSVWRTLNRDEIMNAICFLCKQVTSRCIDFRLFAKCKASTKRLSMESGGKANISMKLFRDNTILQQACLKINAFTCYSSLLVVFHHVRVDKKGPR